MAKNHARRCATRAAVGALTVLAAGCSSLAPIPTSPAPPAPTIAMPPWTVAPAPAAPPSAPPAETGQPSSASTHFGGHLADFGRERVSRDARTIANWVAYSGDNRGLPFIIVDKKQAKVLVFDPDGHLLGVTPALLGLARGDDSVPGIGERPMAEIRPEERTTPAGRFAAEMGRNAGGEDILWVDYDNAVSMHRVRATNPAERRLQRLASKTPNDNRISYGCINLPAAFYDQIVKPAFEPHDGIVYVLPETRPAVAVFGAYTVTPIARR